MSEEKKREHEHNYYPVAVYEGTNYAYVIMKLQCSDENCPDINGSTRWDVLEEIVHV